MTLIIFYGGERWIRTIEVVDNRFTVCSLWPLGNLSMKDWSWRWDSNPQPADYKSAALPIELHQRAEHRSCPKGWWAFRDLNPGPIGYEPTALTN